MEEPDFVGWEEVRDSPSRREDDFLELESGRTEEGEREFQSAMRPIFSVWEGRGRGRGRRRRREERSGRDDKD